MIFPFQYLEKNLIFLTLNETLLDLLRTIVQLFFTMIFQVIGIKKMFTLTYFSFQLTLDKFIN